MKGFRRELLDLPVNLYSEFCLKKSNQELMRIRYFDYTPNWGDHLNPYLVNKITNLPVSKSTFGIKPHLLGIGSILSDATSSSIVWGSGFISSTSRLKHRPKIIKAVRGPLSKKILEQQGVSTPNVFGDPALIMPEYYLPNISKKYRLGIVTHYLEKEHECLNTLRTKGVKIIDVQQDVESFVDSLLECENIISSSLHGLIAADAYGISNKWLRLTNKLIGGDFKFLDYYMSQGVKYEAPLHMSDCQEKSVESLIKKCWTKEVNVSLDDLLECFPLEELLDAI